MVCAIIGVATEFALQRFLMNQLDDQLIEAGRRSAAIFDLPPPPPGSPPPPGMHGHHRFPFDPEEGPGPGFLNAPGQAARTVGAVVALEPARGRGRDHRRRGADRGQCALRPSSFPDSAEPDPRNRRARRTWPLPADRPALAPRRPPDHRDRPARPPSSTTPCCGCSECSVCVAAIALIVATIAGTLIIRRQLAPLSRVSLRPRARWPTSNSTVARWSCPRRSSGWTRPAPIPRSASSASSLNRMLDRIAGALSARHASETRVRQFVADASHELRTPLAAIRGYTELAQRKRDDLPPDVAHAMNRVESETRADDATGRGHAAAGPPRRRAAAGAGAASICPGSWSTRSATRTSPGPTTSGRWTCPRIRCWSSGDEARLHQVLANLLANARTHTPTGTSVTVSLSARRRRGARYC